MKVFKLDQKTVKIRPQVLKDTWLAMQVGSEEESVKSHLLPPIFFFRHLYKQLF